MASRKLVISHSSYSYFYWTLINFILIISGVYNPYSKSVGVDEAFHNISINIDIPTDEVELIPHIAQV